MLRFLLVVILVAVAVYLVIRTTQGQGLRSVRRPQPRRTQPPRVIGPDDDPDFLRDLERKRRHPEDPET